MKRSINELNQSAMNEESQDDDFLFQIGCKKELFTTKKESILFITLVIVLNVFLMFYLNGH